MEAPIEGLPKFANPLPSLEPKVTTTPPLGKPFWLISVAETIGSPLSLRIPVKVRSL